MADHDRLATLETQQKSLAALLVDLEKQMGSHTVSTKSKATVVSFFQSSELGIGVIIRSARKCILNKSYLRFQTHVPEVKFVFLSFDLRSCRPLASVSHFLSSLPQTDQSLAGITAKLQVLEAEQKALSSRMDSGAKVQSTGTLNVGGCQGCEGVQGLIDRALAIFAADRIARPDFALESAGGSIIGTRCTQTYTDRPAVFSLFGIPLFRMSRSPRTVIQPALYPGECWAFRGSKGQLVVRLASNIEVSGITLEHIPKSLAPNGKISSAPRKFVVKGLASEVDYAGVKLGEFEYLDNEQPLQTFDLTPPHKMFRYIELQILSNHGHAEYTCVYRMRVHGKIVGDKESDTEIR